MKVESEDSRKEMPEECDNCGSMVPLERFIIIGPGYNVKWLCPYCRNDFTYGENAVVKSIAAMLNVLEDRIKRNLHTDAVKSNTVQQAAAPDSPEDLYEGCVWPWP